MPYHARSGVYILKGSITISVLHQDNLRDTETSINSVGRV